MKPGAPPLDDRKVQRPSNLGRVKFEELRRRFDQGQEARDKDKPSALADGNDAGVGVDVGVGLGGQHCGDLTSSHGSEDQVQNVASDCREVSKTRREGRHRRPGILRTNGGPIANECGGRIANEQIAVGEGNQNQSAHPVDLPVKDSRSQGPKALGGTYAEDDSRSNEGHGSCNPSLKLPSIQVQKPSLRSSLSVRSTNPNLTTHKELPMFNSKDSISNNSKDSIRNSKDSNHSNSNLTMKIGSEASTRHNSEEISADLSIKAAYSNLKGAESQTEKDVNFDEQTRVCTYSNENLESRFTRLGCGNETLVPWRNRMWKKIDDGVFFSLSRPFTDSQDPYRNSDLASVCDTVNSRVPLSDRMGEFSSASDIKIEKDSRVREAFDSIKVSYDTDQDFLEQPKGSQGSQESSNWHNPNRKSLYLANSLSICDSFSDLRGSSNRPSESPDYVTGPPTTKQPSAVSNLHNPSRSITVYDSLEELRGSSDRPSEFTDYITTPPTTKQPSAVSNLLDSSAVIFKDSIEIPAASSKDLSTKDVINGKRLSGRDDENAKLAGNELCDCLEFPQAFLASKDAVYPHAGVGAVQYPYGKKLNKNIIPPRSSGIRDRQKAFLDQLRMECNRENVFAKDRNPLVARIEPQYTDYFPSETSGVSWKEFPKLQNQNYQSKVNFKKNGEILQGEYIKRRETNSDFNQTQNNHHRNQNNHHEHKIKHHEHQNNHHENYFKPPTKINVNFNQSSLPHIQQITGHHLKHKPGMNLWHRQKIIPRKTQVNTKRKMTPFDDYKEYWQRLTLKQQQQKPERTHFKMRHQGTGETSLKQPCTKYQVPWPTKESSKFGKESHWNLVNNGAKQEARALRNECGSPRFQRSALNIRTSLPQKNIIQKTITNHKEGTQHTGHCANSTKSCNKICDHDNRAKDGEATNNATLSRTIAPNPCRMNANTYEVFHGILKHRNENQNENQRKKQDRGLNKMKNTMTVAQNSQREPESKPGAKLISISSLENKISEEHYFGKPLFQSELTSESDSDNNDANKKRGIKNLKEKIKSSFKKWRRKGKEVDHFHEARKRILHKSLDDANLTSDQDKKKATKTDDSELQDKAKCINADSKREVLDGCEEKRALQDILAAMEQCVQSLMTVESSQKKENDMPKVSIDIRLNTTDADSDDNFSSSNITNLNITKNCQSGEDAKESYFLNDQDPQDKSESKLETTKIHNVEKCDDHFVELETNSESSKKSSSIQKYSESSKCTLDENSVKIEERAKYKEDEKPTLQVREQINNIEQKEIEEKKNSTKRNSQTLSEKPKKYNGAEKRIKALLEKYERSTGLDAILKNSKISRQCCGPPGATGVVDLCQEYGCIGCSTCQSLEIKRHSVPSTKDLENATPCWECNIGQNEALVCHECAGKGQLQVMEAIEWRDICITCGGGGMNNEVQATDTEIFHCLSCGGSGQTGVSKLFLEQTCFGCDGSGINTANPSKAQFEPLEEESQGDATEYLLKDPIEDPRKNAMDDSGATSEQLIFEDVAQVSDKTVPMQEQSGVLHKPPEDYEISDSCAGLVQQVTQARLVQNLELTARKLGHESARLYGIRDGLIFNKTMNAECSVNAVQSDKDVFVQDCWFHLRNPPASSSMQTDDKKPFRLCKYAEGHQLHELDLQEIWKKESSSEKSSLSNCEIPGVVHDKAGINANTNEFSINNVNTKTFRLIQKPSKQRNDDCFGMTKEEFNEAKKDAELFEMELKRSIEKQPVSKVELTKICSMLIKEGKDLRKLQTSLKAKIRKDVNFSNSGKAVERSGMTAMGGRHEPQSHPFRMDQIRYTTNQNKKLN